MKNIDALVFLFATTTTFNQIINVYNLFLRIYKAWKRTSRFSDFIFTLPIKYSFYAFMLKVIKVCLNHKL